MLYIIILTDVEELISITRWNKNFFLNIECKSNIDLTSAIFKLVIQIPYALALNMRKRNWILNSYNSFSIIIPELV